MLLCGIVLCGGAATAQTTIHELTLEQNKSKAVEGKAYLFAVPYTVSVANIESSANASVNASQGKVAIYVYDGARYAAGQDPWVAVSANSELNSGRCYKMVLNGTTQNKWKCRPADNPSEAKNVTVSKNEGASPVVSGWNGVANTAWSKAQGELTGVDYAFRYDNTNSVYVLEQLDRSWEVGEPMIIQTAAAGKLAFSKSGVGFDFGGNMKPGEEFDAPRRLPSGRTESAAHTLVVSHPDGGFNDNADLYLRQQAKNSYVIGQDLAKLHGDGTGVLQMWMEAYGTDLAVHTAALTNGKADIRLHIYAPAEDDYMLTVGGGDAQQFALVRDGVSQSKSSITDWRIHLAKGDNVFTLQYGYPVPAALDEQKNEKHYTKVMRDGQIYILRDGQWFNVLGGRIP